MSDARVSPTPFDPAAHQREVESLAHDALDALPMPTPILHAGVSIDDVVPDAVVGFVSDLVTDLSTPDDVAARIEARGAALEATVRATADDVLHGHMRQVEAERARLRAPAAKAALRGALDRARALQSQRAQLLSGTPEQILAALASPAQDGAAALGTLVGLEPDAHTLAGTKARLAQVDDAYRALVREHPALGALDPAAVPPGITDAALEAKLDEGFDAVQIALAETRAAIEAGDIPLAALDPIVQVVLTEKGWTAEAAEAGDQVAKDVLHYLRREADQEQTVRFAIGGLTLALGVGAMLVTGPLAAAALSAAGMTLGATSAGLEFQQAAAVKDAAHAGLTGESGLADPEAADQAYLWAGVNLAASAVDAGMLAKNASAGLRQAGRLLSPSTGPRVPKPSPSGHRPLAHPELASPPPAAAPTPSRLRFDEVEVQRSVRYERTVLERPTFPRRDQAAQETAVLDRRARVPTEPDPRFDASTVETPAPSAAERRALARADTDIVEVADPSPGWRTYLSGWRRTIERTFDETSEGLGDLVDGARARLRPEPPAPAPKRAAPPAEAPEAPKPAPTRASSPAPEAPTPAAPTAARVDSPEVHRKLLAKEEVLIKETVVKDGPIVAGHDALGPSDPSRFLELPGVGEDGIPDMLRRLERRRNRTPSQVELDARRFGKTKA